MNDTTLAAHLLPPELIIKNFIHGEPDCNYEKFLLEFVNNSDFFRKKSELQLYRPPFSESNGECDCISDKYQLDFKLIASNTILQASSILSLQKTVIAKGVTITGGPKVRNRRIKATRIHAALREYDIHSLRKLREKPTSKQGIENDIFELLETLETNKNLLLFFPYRFTFETEYEFSEGVEQIQTCLNNDFRYVMEYRNCVIQGRDTYMSFIFDGHIVFLKTDNNTLNFVDSVELTKSPIFLNLARYGDVL